MRERITYTVSPMGEVIREYGKVPNGNRLLDEALRPFDQQMRQAHYDLECQQKYRPHQSSDLCARQIREAWA